MKLGVCSFDAEFNTDSKNDLKWRPVLSHCWDIGLFGDHGIFGSYTPYRPQRVNWWDLLDGKNLTDAQTDITTDKRHADSTNTQQLNTTSNTIHHNSNTLPLHNFTSTQILACGDKSSENAVTRKNPGDEGSAVKGFAILITEGILPQRGSFIALRLGWPLRKLQTSVLSHWGRYGFQRSKYFHHIFLNFKLKYLR